MNKRGKILELGYTMSTTQMATTRLLESKFYGILLASIIITGIFVSSAMSSLNSSISIPNSAIIAAISPLHVEGRYIKDVNNNTVVLRGVNKVEWADQPGGTWMGIPVNSISSWNPTNVATELISMQSWGINLIRCHQAIEQWLYNIEQHRQMLKEFIQLAAERGIYVVFDGYSVRNYANGATQDPLPYPPYQTTPGANTIITSGQDYINYMVSVASELKGYPNVIFELWNEPNGNDAAKASWFSVAQRCINAIRATGADNLIIFQWDYNCWANLDFPPPSGSAATMDWVWQANLTDSLGNLVYSTHIYRCYGAFQRSGGRAWTLADIQLAFQYFLFPNVTTKYPLIIGEIGCDLAYTGDELTHELSAFDTCMTLFDQMGISYTPFWWRDIGIFRLHGGAPHFTANAAGNILVAHL